MNEESVGKPPEGATPSEGMAPSSAVKEVNASKEDESAPASAGATSAEAPSAEAPSAEEAPPGESAPEEASAEEEEPPEGEAKAPAKRARQAKPVTVSMLKAAARSPEDVREIVRVESRLREKQRTRADEKPGASAPTGAAKEEATQRETPPGSSQAAKPRPQAEQAAVANPAPKRGAESTQPARKPSVSAKPSAKPALAGQPQPAAQEHRLPRTSPPAGRAGAEPNRSPQSTSRPPSPPRAEPGVKSASAPARQPAPVASSLPVALSVLVVGTTLTLAVLSNAPPRPQGSAAPAVGVASPATRGAASTPQPHAKSQLGSLASIGGGRIVYSDGSGELVVLKGDELSGELELERVYVLRRDRERGIGQPGRRLHGIHLDNLEIERQTELKNAEIAFRAQLQAAHAQGKGVAALDAAAARLARAGGADILVPLLDPQHRTLDRRAATIGLAKAGYRCALPHVANLIRRYAGGPRGRALCELSSGLIGQTLDPRDPGGAAAALEAWCEEHPLQHRYERLVPLPR